MGLKFMRSEDSGKIVKPGSYISYRGGRIMISDFHAGNRMQARGRAMLSMPCEELALKLRSQSHLIVFADFESPS